MDISQAQSQFGASGTYLNTASMGLPPRATVDAVTESIARWGRGELGAGDFDHAVARSRELYADLVGAPVQNVAIGSQTSQLLGHVAANVPDGAEVLVATGDFTSVLFPFLAQQARGVQVRELPMGELASAISASTYAVVSSAVQSADGALLDLGQIREACEQTGTLSVIDVTQAAGWLPVCADDFDVTVCSAYKWLLAPRGVAYLSIKPHVRDGMLVHSASWAGGQDVWDSIYGTPLRLDSGARGLDVSPAWFSWVGQVPSLELLRDVGVPAIQEHNVALADAFLARLGRDPAGSTIVSVPADDSAQSALREAGVSFALRAGQVRLSFHLYNTEDDVNRVADLLQLSRS